MKSNAEVEGTVDDRYVVNLFAVLDPCFFAQSCAARQGIMKMTLCEYSISLYLVKG